MTLQLIYSYTPKSNFRQDMKEIPFELAMVETPEALAETVLAAIPRIRRDALVKVSCCVIADTSDTEELPEWYMESDGKLWFSHGKLLAYTNMKIPKEIAAEDDNGY